jgi:hypothetical protein
MTRFHIHMVVVLLATGVLGLMAGQPGPAIAEDFRVDNTVYVGDQKEPFSESTTIFHDGIVYDCMRTPAETVVFDKAGDRFILLNLAHRTRSELTTTQLAAFVDRLQMLAAKSKDPLAKFLAAPKFQEHSDEAAGELTLSSPWVTYRLVLAPEPNQGVVQQYHEFCDYYARLNALLVPGSRPPSGRLVVDAEMAKRQATASQVMVTFTSGKAPQQHHTTVRSQHRLIRPLESADLERVAQTREAMGAYKLVSFDDYRKLQPR